MFYGAKNGCIAIGDTQMDYISFGRGPQTLVLLPGLGDGLKTVQGMAVTFALLYREMTKDCTVYVFSRKRALEADCTIESMAHDQAAALQALGIARACVVGVSQGGMIAQRLAAAYPQLVQKLVLTVTTDTHADTVGDVVAAWVAMAQAGDYKRLFIDTAEKSYSEAYLKKARPFYAILSKIGAPKSFDRFLLQANACLGHDSTGVLQAIACPTLVIGGGQDKIVGTQAAARLAAGIAHSKLLLYKEFGHALYDEAKDYNAQILAFARG